MILGDILLSLFIVGSLARPLRHEDGLSLGEFPQISEFGDHIARSKVIPGLVKTISQDDQDRQGRFSLPGPIPIDTEQIKKVAQILLVLGEQVIPAILGEGGGNMVPMKSGEISNDEVDE